MWYLAEWKFALSMNTGAGSLEKEFPPDDRELLSRIGGGDELAFEELYGRYANAVMGFCVSRTRDRETAREVFDDVWMACWRSARSYRGEGKVLAWLLGIAKRQMYMSWRSKNRQATVGITEVVETLQEDSPGPEAQMMSACGVEELHDVLSLLPKELLETVTLAWLHDIPVGTVKSRVTRARKMLRQHRKANES